MERCEKFIKSGVLVRRSQKQQDHILRLILRGLKMLRSLSLLGYASAVAAQFNIVHTQYGTSPPVYPSPQISGGGGWDAALEKSQAFLAELTLQEKAQMVTGMQLYHTFKAPGCEPD